MLYFQYFVLFYFSFCFYFDLEKETNLFWIIHLGIKDRGSEQLKQKHKFFKRILSNIKNLVQFCLIKFAFFASVHWINFYMLFMHVDTVKIIPRFSIVSSTLELRVLLQKQIMNSSWFSTWIYIFDFNAGTYFRLSLFWLTQSVSSK